MPPRKDPHDLAPLLDDPSLAFNLSARQAAALLGISERMLWTLTSQGQVPCQRLGRRRLYPRPLLEAWAVEQAKRPAASAS